jgi:hypothetical protein
MTEAEFLRYSERLKTARTEAELNELSLEIARLEESEERLALVSMAKAMQVLLEEQARGNDGQNPD